MTKTVTIAPDKFYGVAGYKWIVILPGEARIADFSRAKGKKNNPPHIMKEEFRGDGPCSDCETLNNPVWYTDNVFWNEVVEDKTLILCPQCFIDRAERKFEVTGWRIIPDWKWKQKA